MRFAILHKFPGISSVEISECAGELVKCYFEIDAHFPNELLNFLKFVSSESDKSPHNMLKFILRHSLISTYPNSDVILRIYLCNSGTSSERSFYIETR